MNNTVKYEVVIGVPDDKFVNGKYENQIEKMINKWQEFAKEFFDQTGTGTCETGTYVSAIANSGKAIYHTDWGCPDHGERVVTFNCTANPTFIKDLDKYEEGVLYITKKLKKEFQQHTITITCIPVGVFYLTDENEDDDDV